MPEAHVIKGPMNIYIYIYMYVYSIYLVVDILGLLSLKIPKCPYEKQRDREM